MRKFINVNPGNIDNIIIDNPDVTDFFFIDGVYFLTKKLLINKPYISFGGTSAKKVHIIQNNPDQDGFDIEADYFKMYDISLHVTHPGRVTIVFADCNNTSVSNCFFYGSPDTFTIFYAGPQIKAGIDTLNAYNENRLDSGNKFYKNTIYSKWSGDAVSFSLQKNGLVQSNIIRGGKFAIYMCNDVKVANNTIYDSTSHGIFVSLPSHNIDIVKNNIYECTNSGITIKNQLEHGEFNSSPYYITILKNKIYDMSFHGVEINDGININIENNTIMSKYNTTIYAQNSSQLTIINNQLAYFKYGVRILNSNNISTVNNDMLSIFPYTCKTFINFSGSSEITISDNILKGLYITNTVDIVNSLNVEINNNTEENYYDYQEENKLIKKLL